PSGWGPEGLDGHGGILSLQWHHLWHHQFRGPHLRVPQSNLARRGGREPSLHRIHHALAGDRNDLFLSMVAGVLTDKLGIRVTTVAGGAIANSRMFLSSIYYKQPKILIVTMGLIFGTGASLAYTPSLVILGHYFFKKLGIVNGVVTAGSSVFTIIISELLRLVIDKHGLKTCFQVLSGLMAVLMVRVLSLVCGFTFKPLLPDLPAPPPPEAPGKSVRARCRRFFSLFINFEIWKNKRYVLWTLAIPSALFGYFVPYIHLVAYAKDVLGKDVNTRILVQCIGGTSGLGRIFFGLIADKPWVNRIVLQQISFFCIGCLTMLLVAANQFWIFIVISLGMGLFDGCFISLLGPIAFDIVGPVGASQAIGCLLAFCSIPLTIGPYVAGTLYDHLGSYVVPFLCAGIPPILGGLALFFMRCIEVPPKVSSKMASPFGM
ncbi:UNVERIFIED_CONTAM: hypothetical protein GTU68_064098, partial [Idotea baltica]|nr:hypothetical protein [Idotea baltica]